MKQIIAWKSDDGSIHEDEMSAFNADLEYWKQPLKVPKQEFSLPEIPPPDAEEVAA